jgi:hypothetical protein
VWSGATCVNEGARNRMQISSAFCLLYICLLLYLPLQLSVKGSETLLVNINVNCGFKSFELSSKCKI